MCRGLLEGRWSFLQCDSPGLPDDGIGPAAIISAAECLRAVAHMIRIYVDMQMAIQRFSFGIKCLWIAGLRAAQFAQIDSLACACALCVLCECVRMCALICAHVCV